MCLEYADAGITHEKISTGSCMILWGSGRYLQGLVVRPTSASEMRCLFRQKDPKKKKEKNLEGK